MNEGFPKTENNVEQFPIKNGVSFVFEQQPELANIGTQEKYSEYLDTIFPESKFKEIVYHGSSHKFDDFVVEDNASSGNFGIGIYTTPDKSWAQKYARSAGFTHGVILNIKDPFITSLRYKEYYGGYTFTPKIKMSEYIGNDAIFNYEGLDRDKLKLFNEYLLEYIGEKNELGLPAYQAEIYSNPELKEIVVFNDNQTHILGSQKDIDRFKEFVSAK